MGAWDLPGRCLWGTNSPQADGCMGPAWALPVGHAHAQPPSLGLAFKLLSAGGLHVVKLPTAASPLPGPPSPACTFLSPPPRPPCNCISPLPPTCIPRLTSLAWNPDGRLLACCSPDMAGLLVWDVGLGTSTAVSCGLACLHLLRWSPCGNYLFAGQLAPPAQPVLHMLGLPLFTMAWGKVGI